jgi:hypothetical protein
MLFIYLFICDYLLPTNYSRHLCVSLHFSNTCTTPRVRDVGGIQQRLRCAGWDFFLCALRDSISQYINPSQEKTPIYRISHLKLYSEGNKIPGILEVGITRDSH